MVMLHLDYFIKHQYDKADGLVYVSTLVYNCTLKDGKETRKPTFIQIKKKFNNKQNIPKPNKALKRYHYMIQIFYANISISHETRQLALHALSLDIAIKVITCTIYLNNQTS